MCIFKVCSFDKLFPHQAHSKALLCFNVLPFQAGKYMLPTKIIAANTVTNKSSFYLGIKV